MTSVKRKYYIVLLGLIGLCTSVWSQEVIVPYNSSFEGRPFQGEHIFTLNSWMDCMFHRGETPPDVHSFSTNYFGVTTPPADRQTFLGMVARETETNESVSQQLPTALRKDRCYEFSIFLAHDVNYRSKVNLNRMVKDSTSNIKLFDNPIKLIVWGGNSYCMRSQKLAESPAVENTDWREYVMQISPDDDYQYITLEAYWNTPVLMPYNGNVLVDKLSPFVEINCDEGLAKVQILDFESAITINEQPGSSDRSSNVGDQSPTEAPTSIEKPVEKKIKVVSGMKVEEFIRSSKELTIQDLIFDADTFNIKKASYATLDEIYYFLDENPQIHLDIMGHTNNLPPHEFCDTLSLRRAQAVKNYLVDKGTSQARLKAIGYGKRRPLVSNKTFVGRERNQRVEIKITRR